jgi:hypothetical protein
MGKTRELEGSKDRTSVQHAPEETEVDKDDAWQTLGVTDI